MMARALLCHEQATRLACNEMQMPGPDSGTQRFRIVLAHSIPLAIFITIRRIRLSSSHVPRSAIRLLCPMVRLCSYNQASSRGSSDHNTFK
jgi:hypothetical protein